MMDNSFLLNNYFDLNNFFIKNQINRNFYVWRLIGDISKIINEIFVKNILRANYSKTKNVYIGKGTTIEESVKIEGPAIIGNNCVIKHASLIRENCILGDRVIIGHASEVKNSIVFNDASVSHFNYIGDSIIGNKVNIAGGAILANMRFDKKEIIINSVKTGLLKFGAVVGDGSSIGVNAVLNPGTIIGKNSFVYPLTSVKGVHDDGEIIK